MATLFKFRTPFLKVASLLLLVFVVSSCWEKDDPKPARKDIYGSWVLQYIELPGEGGGTSRVEGRNITLNLTNVSTHQQANSPFANDLNGKLPVNYYFGRYSVTGSPIVPSEDPQAVVLDIRDLGSTRIGGTGELMQLESLYLKALDEVSLATLTKGGSLVLQSHHQNAKLVFKPSEECSLPD